MNSISLELEFKDTRRCCVCGVEEVFGAPLYIKIHPWPKKCCWACATCQHHFGLEVVFPWTFDDEHLRFYKDNRAHDSNYVEHILAKRKYILRCPLFMHHDVCSNVWGQIGMKTYETIGTQEKAERSIVVQNFLHEQTRIATEDAFEMQMLSYQTRLLKRSATLAKK